MEQSSKVSIVVPVYNVEPYLRQCVDSLVNQTLREIEVILVNDGSTDGSGQICDEYAAVDPRVKVIHKKNGGLSDTRNQGMLHVTSKYLLFIDSDDWMELEACEVAYNEAENLQADVVFWTWTKEFPTHTVAVVPLFDKDTFFEGEEVKFLHRRTCGIIGKELRQPTKTDALVTAWGKLIRFDLLKENNIKFVDTKEIGSEDSLFTFQLYYYCERVKFLYKFYGHYRKDNPASITKNHRSSLMPRYLNLFKYMEDFIEEKKLPIDFWDALNNRVAFSTINVVLSITGPRNSISLPEKIKDIREILHHPIYIRAYNRMDFTYLPAHWKVFFRLAKLKSAVGIYLLSILMRKMRD